MFKGKLLISIASFATISAASGGIYYLTKNSNNEQSILKNSLSEGTSNIEVQAPEILEDECAKHAKTNPRGSNVSYLVDWEKYHSV